MVGDPHAVYRLPREAQVELLALLQADDIPGVEAVEADLTNYIRTGRRRPNDNGPREWRNSDPEQGARLPRDPSVVAVNKDARRRADRFRVA